MKNPFDPDEFKTSKLLARVLQLPFDEMQSELSKEGLFIGKITERDQDKAEAEKNKKKLDSLLKIVDRVDNLCDAIQVIEHANDVWPLVNKISELLYKGRTL